jgi:hypothetical protein
MLVPFDILTVGSDKAARIRHRVLPVSRYGTLSEIHPMGASDVLVHLRIFALWPSLETEGRGGGYTKTAEPKHGISTPSESYTNSGNRDRRPKISTDLSC